MMKDLKHYFSSPKDNVEQQKEDTIKVGNPENDNLVEKLNDVSKNIVIKEKSKKKKRKRKLSDSDLSLTDVSVIDDVFEPLDKKKRKRSNGLLKSHKKINDSIIVSDEDVSTKTANNCTPVIGKRSKTIKKARDSGSSKENSVGSDHEEKISATPENSKNLFNYFNKVDKLPEIEEKPRKIKVEAIIHADSSGSPPTEITLKKSNIKKRKSKSRKSVIDFDLITTETLPEEVSTTDKTNKINLAEEPILNVNNPKPLPDVEVKVEKVQRTPRNVTKEPILNVNNPKPLPDVEVKVEKAQRTPRNVNKDSVLKVNNSKALPDDKVNEDHETPRTANKVKKSGPVASLNKSETENGDIKVAESVETPKTALNIKSGLEKLNGIKSSRTKNKLSENELPGGGLNDTKTEIPLTAKDQGNADVVIVNDEDIPKKKPKVKHDGTLASFFNLGNRSSPLPLEKKSSAKLQFLMSGTPPAAKRPGPVSSCQGCIAPFPTTSHIQQKEEKNLLWNLQPISFEFKPVSLESIKPAEWSSFLKNKDHPIVTTKQEIPFFDTKAMLKHLKKELNLFPISCWVKELKKMKKGNEDFMWNERYRPHSSSAFLANTRSISKLKAWLTELKESSIAESGASSGDEFIKDNDDEQKFDRKTVVLLTGPPGTGKTASVYAIAEEIGYNVLEINASCNRSGKRILNEFSEAMQSHKVGVSKLQISKVKKKPTEEPKRSLILIEDADLLFEDDEGFVPTLINLGASTKRPIILVANNPQAKHFTKLAPLFHSTLDFVPPTLDRLGSWLRTVSAVEGFYLGPEDSGILASCQDLRKCLLQLQLAKANMKGIKKEDEQESVVWNSASSLSFSSKRRRQKGKRIMSTLAHLDIIRPNKVAREAIPYWQRPLEDSTLNLESQAMHAHSLEGIEPALLGLLSPLPASSSQPHSKNAFNEIPRNLLEIEKDACSLTSILNRRGLTLDYWPVLRQISRSETTRLASHTKRNNRYFNYLSSLGVKGPPDMFQTISSTFS